MNDAAPEIVPDSIDMVEGEADEPVRGDVDGVPDVALPLDPVVLGAAEEIEDVDEAETIEVLDVTVLIEELDEDDDVVEGVGVITSAVEPADCVVVTSVDVPDPTAAGPVLVGGVVPDASQKLVNWSNSSSRYERSVILLAAPFVVMHELQPARSVVKAESGAQSSADFPVFCASEKALSQIEKHTAGKSVSSKPVWRSRSDFSL